MLVRGGHLVDPSQDADGRFDLRLDNGVVVEIGEHLEPLSSEPVVDAAGAFVAPGFIDMHVHLREPGHPEKETIETGCAAALAGGFTAVACMPNTQPALDTPERLAWVRDRAERAGLARVYPIAAITQGREGRAAVDFTALEAAGAVAFSDDGTTIADFHVQYAAAATGTPRLFVTHCEDMAIKRDAVMTDDPRVAIAEDVVVMRDVLIAQATRQRWHIAHVSTRNAVEFIRWAKARGIAATCEVTPHHLVFSADDVAELQGRGKVNPPLRYHDDVRALRDAVRDGSVDAFATDHAPHLESEKQALHDACVGFTGLEVALGAYAAAVPDLPLRRFVELLSCNPARLLGVPGGTLRRGAPADVTLFAEREWLVDPARFFSKGKSTPFAGKRLPRRAIATIVGGRLLMHDGRIMERTDSR